MRAFHQQVEQAVILDTDLTQLRFERRTLEENPIIFKDLTLFGGNFILGRQVANVDSRFRKQFTPQL